MVHKSGHHFDLVNWWIDSSPETVAGFGKLCFYGEEAGKKHGWAKDYERARGSEDAKKDPFAIHLEADDLLKKLYAEAEGEDGYHRDQNVRIFRLTWFMLFWNFGVYLGIRTWNRDRGRYERHGSL